MRTDTIFPTPARTLMSSSSSAKSRSASMSPPSTTFKKMAADLGMPYQNLINLFLRDCALRKRRPMIQWPEDTVKQATVRQRK